MNIQLNKWQENEYRTNELKNLKQKADEVKNSITVQ